MGRNWAKHAYSRVMGRMIAEVTRPLQDAAKMAGWAVAIAIPAVVACIFFLFAAFVWAERTYGTIEACLLLGALFLAIAGLVLAAWLLVRRRRRNEQRRASSLHGLSDPAVIAAGLELVRIVGVRRIIPVVAIGAVILGALEEGRRAKV